MKKLSRLLSATAIAGLVLAACVPIFSNGAFQTLKLAFALSAAIEEGETELLHVSVFPQTIKVRKTFVQISGQLVVPAGETPANKVKALAVFEGAGSGKVVQRLSLTLNVKQDGTFIARKKVKQNIGAGDMMTVSLEPSGGRLAKDTEITLCVDLVKKKSELKNLPACVEQNGGSNGGGGSQVTLTSLQNDFFTPTCAVSGCHNGASASAGLVLTAGQSFGNLVNVASSQNTSLDRVSPNDPEASYLIKKLRGDSDIIGQRMPLGGPFLSASELDRFVTWIGDGASNN
jgi:hypothetical protein